MFLRKPKKRQKNHFILQYIPCSRECFLCVRCTDFHHIDSNCNVQSMKIGNDNMTPKKMMFIVYYSVPVLSTTHHSISLFGRWIWYTSNMFQEAEENVDIKLFFIENPFEVKKNSEIWIITCDTYCWMLTGCRFYRSVFITERSLVTQLICVLWAFRTSIHIEHFWEKHFLFFSVFAHQMFCETFQYDFERINPNPSFIDSW